MNINSSANNYFRPATHLGIHQKVASRGTFDLPGGLLLWRAVAKVSLWGVPVVLALNLLCGTLIHSETGKIEELRQALATIEEANIELRTERARKTSPQMVKVAAAEKLSLFEPVPGQIQPM